MSVVLTGPSPVDHPRLLRRIDMGDERAAWLFEIATASDVDDEIRALLTGSYFGSGP